MLPHLSGVPYLHANRPLVGYTPQSLLGRFTSKSSFKALDVTQTGQVTTYRPCPPLKFNAFRSSVHTNTLSFFTAGKCIDLKTLLKMDQNRNAYISY